MTTDYLAKGLKYAWKHPRGTLAIAAYGTNFFRHMVGSSIYGALDIAEAVSPKLGRYLRNKNVGPISLERAIRIPGLIGFAGGGIVNAFQGDPTCALDFLMAGYQTYRMFDNPTLDSKKKKVKKSRTKKKP